MNINNINTLINFLIENRYKIKYEDALRISKKCIPKLINPIVWVGNNKSKNLDANAFLISAVINSKKQAFSIKDCYLPNEAIEELIKWNTNK